MTDSQNHIFLETAHDLEPLRNFVREKILPLANASEGKETFPVEIFEELHRLGWLQAFIPEELGGSGFTALDLACVAREIGYASTGIFTSWAVHMLGMSPIILYGSEALKKKLCSRFLSKFEFWSYCMTEPDTGSNIAHAKTKARKVNGGYVIDGQKCFITNAGYSQHLTVFASLESANEQGRRLTAFYIPGDSPGLVRGKEMDKIGQRDSNTGELFFDGVFVPEEHRIGVEGAGLKMAFHSLQRSKTMIAAAAVGMCRRAYELVNEYLRGRCIYKQPLLGFPTIQVQLADLQTRVEAAWLLTCKAAGAWQQGIAAKDYAIKEASMAKMYATDVAVKYISEAVELFGGYGYTREFEISRLYRDCKVIEIYEGPTLVQQMLIAKELFPDLTGRKATEEKKAA